MFERIIADQATARPNATAFRLGLDLALSYRTMADDIRRTAAWLGKRGVPAGARVVLHLDDPYLHWVFVFACEALGLVFVCDGSKRTIDADRLAFYGAAAVVASAASPGLAGVTWIAIDRLWQSRMRSLRPLPLPRRPRRDDDPVCILLSSGTTGEAKKVLLTRRLIDLRIGHIMTAYATGLAKGQLLLIPVQTFGGFNATLTAMLEGRPVGLPLPGVPYREMLATGDYSSIIAAPIMAERVMADLPADATPIDGFRITVGGGALAEPLADDIRARLTPDIRMGYGTTESGLVTIAPTIAPHTSEGYAGRILPWIEVSVVDPAGAPVAPGTTGEIRLRGDEVVAGYLDDPDGTARHFRDGWYHPGDLGRVDADGGLTIEGRIDELLNIGGRKLLPGLVERRLAAIPGIADVAAFGVHDQATGTPRLAVAYVADAPVAPDAVAAAIPDFPNIQLRRVAEIPRNLMGKIERRALAALPIAPPG